MRTIVGRFEWANTTEFAITAATLALAASITWTIRGRRDTPLIHRIRSVQTGSVNDYLAYQFVGLIAVIVALVTLT